MAFFKALALFLGTIIGAGIFGLPFVAKEAGFWVVFGYFCVFSAVTVYLYSLYGKVILASPERSRLPGYAGRYLGKMAQNIAFFTVILGLAGSLLAYLVIGGGFLQKLLSPYLEAPEVFFYLLFFLPAAFLVFGEKSKGIAGAEILFLALLGFLLLAMLFFAAPLIQIKFFKGFEPVNIFIPYGVVIFSLSGSAVLPEAAGILRGKKNAGKKLRNVILSGLIASSLIYLLFIFVTLGVSGSDTSRDAISGLEKFLGFKAAGLGYVLGVAACFTSFLTLALVFRKTLQYDFGIKKNLSWVLACFSPLLLLALGLDQFINIIAFTGAIALGVENIILIFLYRAFSGKNSFKSALFLYFLAAIFVAGVIMELFYLSCY